MTKPGEPEVDDKRDVPADILPLEISVTTGIRGNDIDVDFCEPRIKKLSALCSQMLSEGFPCCGAWGKGRAFAFSRCGSN